ncbi:resistance to Congo red protein [Mycobacteroides abscessus]|uniref:resistance to Congo red protein n=1 Tax=Mycobacteroides abscessus TaxID=36809 RepID=UPI000AF552FA|nr:resistance to Congo red protein [Mycobacteroides abscessus]
MSVYIKRRLIAFAVGLAVVALCIPCLHNLRREDISVVSGLIWYLFVLTALLAISGGIKLVYYGLSPLYRIAFEQFLERPSSTTRSTLMALFVLAGSGGLWWILTGRFARWWVDVTHDPDWSLPLALNSMLVAAVSGSMVFNTAHTLIRYVDSSKDGHSQDGKLKMRHKRHSYFCDLNPLVAGLVGAAGIVIAVAWLNKALLPYLTGDQFLMAVIALVLLLIWTGCSSQLCWFALTSLWVYIRANCLNRNFTKISAACGAVFVVMICSNGWGLGWISPSLVAPARAVCPPNCDGNDTDYPQPPYPNTQVPSLQEQQGYLATPQEFPYYGNQASDGGLLTGPSFTPPELTGGPQQPRIPNPDYRAPETEPDIPKKEIETSESAQGDTSGDENASTRVVKEERSGTLEPSVSQVNPRVVEPDQRRTLGPSLKEREERRLRERREDDQRAVGIDMAALLIGAVSNISIMRPKKPVAERRASSKTRTDGNDDAHSMDLSSTPVETTSTLEGNASLVSNIADTTDLEKEIRELRRNNLILKKTTGIFVAEWRRGNQD